MIFDKLYHVEALIAYIIKSKTAIQLSMRTSYKKMKKWTVIFFIKLSYLIREDNLVIHHYYNIWFDLLLNFWFILVNYNKKNNQFQV